MPIYLSTIFNLNGTIISQIFIFRSNFSSKKLSTEIFSHLNISDTLLLKNSLMAFGKINSKTNVLLVVKWAIIFVGDSGATGGLEVK